MAVQEKHLVLQLLARPRLLKDIHKLDAADADGGVPRLLRLANEARARALACRLGSCGVRRRRRLGARRANLSCGGSC